MNLSQMPVHPMLNSLRVRPARLQPVRVIATQPPPPPPPLVTPPVPMLRQESLPLLPPVEDDSIKLMPVLDMIRSKTKLVPLRKRISEEFEHCHRQEYRWKLKPFIMLRDVKKTLKRRDWGRLFPASVAKKASVAVSIANNAALCRPKNFARLPLITSTLYVLSRLPAARLQAGIESGEITSDTDYRQAVAFVRKNSRAA